jgi:hypothetical protein
MGPDRQFQSALEALRRRPEPDLEGAVSNAVSALEAVVRIITNDDKVLLGPGIDRLQREHGLHGALASSIKALYGYASDAGGRHGLVGSPDVDHHIAEFCLHQSAAAIVFVARLRGLGVVRDVPD